MRDAQGGSSFRGDVEGLRAVAILAVVLFHAVERRLPGGFVGVDVFFVISGYVITRSIKRRRDDTGTSSLTDFYVRRAKRILPAITVFLVVVLPLVLVAASAYEFPRSLDTAAASSVFVANFELLSDGAPAYFGDMARGNAFLHTWSLSVEEQFYLVFPVVVLGALAFASRRGRGDTDWTTVRRVLIGLTVLSFVGMLVVASGDRQAAFYLAPTRAWEFLAGAILALVPLYRGRGATGYRIGGLALIAASSLFFVGAAYWPGPLTVVPVAGAAMVIGVAPEAGRLRFVLDNPIMRRLGALSYGWYLWHWPAIVVVEQTVGRSGRLALLAGFGALVPAALSLRLIENPIRFSKPRRPVPVLGTAAASVAVLLVFTLVLVPAADESLPGSVDDITARADLEHIQATAICSQTPTPEVDTCQRVVDADAPVAVLLGDSVGAQLAIPFHEAATALGMSSRVATMLSCAFLPGLRVEASPGSVIPGCEAHNDAILADLLDDPPSVVVISNHLGHTLGSHTVVSNEDGTRSSGADIPGTVTATLVDTIEALDAAGTRVVLVRRPPPAGEFAVYDCARWRWVLDEVDCGSPRSLESALAIRQAEDDVIDRVADQTDARVLDPAEVTCSSWCRAYRNGAWVYGDASHVTGQFAPALAPLLTEGLQPTGS